MSDYDKSCILNHDYPTKFAINGQYHLTTINQCIFFGKKVLIDNFCITCIEQLQIPEQIMAILKNNTQLSISDDFKTMY